MPVDSAVSIGWDVLKWVVVPIKRQFGYVISSKSYAQDLQKEVRKLAYKAQRIHNDVEVARNNLRIVYSQVTEWQESAEKALKEAEDLLGDFEKASKTCCYGTLPDPKWRYQFSRKADGKIKVIKQLAQECSGFKELNDISFSNPAPGNVAAPNLARREGKDVVQSTTTRPSVFSASTSIKVRDGYNFESRAQIIRDIEDALADNSNSVVGVYGMGGLGKSTLLGEVKRIISKEKSFDWVAKADVSKNPNINSIQEEIAHALGLSDEIKKKESISLRAELLRERLEKEEREKKKVLIILDNLWEGLDLKSVGIPCGHDNKVIGCKLLLTSRDYDVLRVDMGCDKAFPLGGLKEGEAKSLFERLVGDNVHKDELKSLVDEALHKCAGVPFLIVAMAKRLRNADLPEWKDTLKKIKKFKDKKNNDLINQMLQWSYSKLEEEQKSLLRLCVVYVVSKPSLENLVRYGFGLGIFQGVDSMEEARDRLRSQIHTLQASSLLLDSEDVDGFKMHDLVREFVASVSSIDHPLLVLKDKVESVIELLKDKPNSYQAICFPYVDMEELSQELDCPELRIFLLFKNYGSFHVPDSLFNSMRKLMVLNVTGIVLTCSPTLIQSLENLHTLCLQHCSIEDVAILGKLKGLQILSIVESQIQRLPKEIGQLVELRLLDLSHCSQLEIIEPGVLQSLIKLEELYMENSFDQWNAVEQTPPTNASLIELNHMKNLRTLNVSIPNSSVLPEDLNVEKLTNYKIRIGNARRYSKYKGSRTLELKLDPISDVLRKGCMQSILDKTDDLFLDGLNETEQSICALSRGGFPELKHLQVQNSPSVHHIFWRPSLAAFKTLEWLRLNNLINLEKISNNNIPSGSFSALKVVRVKSCDKMEVLFPLSVVRELSKLEEIKVVSCKLVRGIVEADDRGKFELPKLRVLEMRDLPNIKNFSSAGSAPSSSSTLDDQVGTQIAFFNGQQVSIPSLESLIMEGLPNVKELWSDESPLGHNNLQSIKVVGCQSLSKVISSKSVVKLLKLRTLSIGNCRSVQEIFDLDGPSASGNVETLSQLTTLQLYELPSLRCIWNKSPYGIVSFHNLKGLEVRDFDNLEFLFFPSMVKSLAQLRDLTISNCKKMEAIITEEEGLGMETSETPAFPILTNLCLKWLKSLTCFSRGKRSREAQCPGSIQSRSTALFNREVSIPSLESLIMEGLPNVKEIWSDESPLGQSNLKSIKVVGCESLSKVFSSRSVVKLLKLRTLSIRNCRSVQEIFDLDGPSASGDVETLSQLTTLELYELPSLRRIWNKSPCGIVSFHNLKGLELQDFDNLEFLFFPSMVKSLAQLRYLIISNCKKMEAIVTKEEGMGMKTSETPAFPILTYLCLQWLESLTCFSRGKRSREAQCPDRIQSRSIALFNREVSIPSLESLTMEGLPNVKEIWSDESPLGQSNLKSIKVVGCESLSKVFSSRSVVKLLKLRTLSIRNCRSVQEIFDLDGPSASGNVETLSQLTTLELYELPSLRRIWNKSPCGIVSFHNLKGLVVQDFDNLEFLFFPSMVKSLAQLRYLIILNCKKMEAIITEEEGMGMETSETPAFPILTYLCLQWLESLTCFSRGKRSREAQCLNGIQSRSTALFNREVSIPSLESLTMEGLPNVKEIWSDESPLGQSNLQSLNVVGCESLSKVISSKSVVKLLKLCTLNIRNCRSVQEIFDLDGPSASGNVETLSQLTNLELYKLPSLRCIWNKSPCGIVSFHNLKRLEVQDIENLEFLFFPSMVKSLAQLRDLTISNCKKMEAIITEEERLGMETSETPAFPILTNLRLKWLDR